MTFPYSWLHFGRHPSERLLVAHHDGEASGKVLTRLLKHLNSCPECRAKAALLDYEWSCLSMLNGETEILISEDTLLEGFRACILTSPRAVQFGLRMEW
jgi:hypothetical protein